MSADTPNPPAFPAPDFARSSTHEGMTLRDYFAAKAMQALLRDANSTDGCWHVEANAAYAISDAMLAARGDEK